MKQLYDFGKYLRNYYSLFLNEFYKEYEVDAISTDFDRTIMSTSAMLAGLYKPRGYQKFDDQLDWQPIPVHINTERANKVILLIRFIIVVYII